MEPMSPNAEKIVDDFRQATEPSAEEQEAAWSRLQANLRRSGVVTRDQIRRHRLRWLWQGILRGVVVGGALASFLFVADRGCEARSSRKHLARAQSHLDSGRPESAYRLLVRHAKQHPTREAAEARIPLVLDALCDMDLEERAQQQIDEFLRQVPDSEHASRASDVCPGRPPLAAESEGPPSDPEVAPLTPSPAPNGIRTTRSDAASPEAASPEVASPEVDAASPPAAKEPGTPSPPGEGAIEIDEAPMVIRPGKEEPTRFFSTLEGPVTPPSDP